jgi:hypothetical protein
VRPGSNEVDAMPSLNEKIADSLSNLMSLSKGGTRRVFKTNDISRTDRERLLEAGFLNEIIKGWVMTTRPSDRQGDSTAWYSSFWEFARAYLDDRFHGDWTVSPEGSVLLHAQNLNVPHQVIFHSPSANNQLVDLPHATSFYLLRVPKLVTTNPVEIAGVRAVPDAESLCLVGPAFWQNNKNDVVALIGAVRSAAILRVLLAGGHAVVAGRVAGAYRLLGNAKAADEIVSTMRRAGHDVREDADPFRGPVPMQLTGARPVSPISTRIRLMWAEMRGQVLQNFDIEPRLINDHDAFMASVDDIYTSDAYHSLSIEGYKVTEDLIEKVRKQKWNPDDDPADREQNNALAAKGYWDAFQEVRKSVDRILKGEASADIVEAEHLNWYRALFLPSVAAGISKPENMVGYRQHFLYLKGSRHTPPNWESLPDAMDAYFECLKNEDDPRVRAVLGHFVFTYIHPLPDGNGRTGRFIMNAMLASGGIRWTVVPVDRRNEYMQALDTASSKDDIGPFSRLIADCAKHEPPPPRRSRPGETLAEMVDESPSAGPRRG